MESSTAKRKVEQTRWRGRAMGLKAEEPVEGARRDSFVYLAKGPRA